MITLHLLAIFSAFILLILIAAQDIKSLRISNNIVFALIASFVLFEAPALAMHELLERLAIASAVLVVTFLFSLSGKFGAGDSKALSAFCLHVPLSLFSLFLILISISGILCYLVLALAWRVIAAPRLRHADGSEEELPAWLQWKVWRERDRVPYGLAIAVAGSAVLFGKLMLVIDFYDLNIF